MGAVKPRLPGWRVRIDHVNYVDPHQMVFTLPTADDEIYFFKDFRFMYQLEWRMIAVPPVDFDRPLEDLAIEVGSLEDIARLVSFRS